MGVDVLQLAVVVAIGAALIYILFSRQRADYKKHVQQLQPKKVKTAVKREFKTYTREEVAKHSTRDDAWIIVQHKRTKEWRVYDITEYIDEHPGGEAILKNAGKDSTAGFHGPHHPDTVFVLVEDFCIGTLADP
mmetsp:Transcript_8860/g.18931  ORF Transcript_8860/g.18931 Transcript_8860/m.18931 type:complete len:134 (+) Transcript_8860:52-453(+)